MVRSMLILTPLLFAVPALAPAQETSPPVAAALADLPEACRTAPTEGTEGTADAAPMEDSNKSSATMKGYGSAIERMNEQMAATMYIQDPDLAFACGMIAHHMGAINMAKGLQTDGQDQAMKDMAQKMIDAQTKEIDELTTWVDGHGKT